MNTKITKDKIEELILHSLTVNMTESKLPFVSWEWSDVLGTCMGRCAYSVPLGPRKQTYFHIFFSRLLFSRATDYERRGVVVHEACHASEFIRVGPEKHMADCHGFDWETAVLRTGYEPFATHDVDVTGEEYKPCPLTMPFPKVHLKCS
jgi:hypothetical protein